MQIHNLIQGSPEWHKHRAEHFNASDAPAMMGISKYKTRSQLLHEMATGIAQEFDSATDKRFADGHRFEALARPIAEGIIGEDLFPVTGSLGNHSASFDGLTEDYSICFEHKTLNDDIRKAMGANGNTGGLDEMYRVQMEQQLMISGATQCLFMASKWDGEKMTEEVHGWYLPDLVLRGRIALGWQQFAKDLENYMPPEVIEKPVADVIMGLPAVSIQATGMITASNLPEFKKAAETFIANIKTELVTDEDFSNAEANVKFCKSAEDDLEGTKKAILAQTTTIDEAIKTIDYIKAQLATKRIMLDKLVKSEKESRKLAIIDKARISFNDHFVALESEIKPIRLIGQHPDFAGAMKGLKKLSAMQDAVDTALANGKIEIEATAKDIRAKLAWCKENAAGHSALFPDLQQLIAKPMEDFTLTITSRIEKHKADEAARLESEREKIRAEEEAKAIAKIKAESDAKIDAMVAQKRAEIFAFAEIEKEQKGLIDDSPATVRDPVNIFAPRNDEDPLPASLRGIVNTSPSRPKDGEIIAAIIAAFGVSYGTACDWIIQAAESIQSKP